MDEYYEIPVEKEYLKIMKEEVSKSSVSKEPYTKTMVLVYEVLIEAIDEAFTDNTKKVLEYVKEESSKLKLIPISSDDGILLGYFDKEDALAAEEYLKELGCIISEEIQEEFIDLENYT